jgi:hypothetical protein
VTEKIWSTFSRLSYGVLYENEFPKTEFKWTTVASEFDPALCSICQKGIGKYFFRGNFIFHSTESLDFFGSFFCFL